MTDNVETLIVETPVLTAEQKLQIREAQVKMLTLQVQIRQYQDQADQLAKDIIGHINQLANQMKIDPTKFTLDIDNLAFVPIK